MAKNQNFQKENIKGENKIWYQEEEWDKDYQGKDLEDLITVDVLIAGI